MAKSKKKRAPQRPKKPTRYQRNLQIAAVVVSILLVISLTLSLINF